ncbi:MAG: VPDSG-CTERM sorting domain-containing protein [Verrucomicrobia bacterium]|nr:VPDSG-CTERM sorting domain-containing protein [Verrucomicrobiota bacterium]
MKLTGSALLTRALALASLFAIVSAAQAAIIDFTGGSVSGAYANHYEENGFQVDVTGASGAFFGDYYGVGNNVIHAHWATGPYGNVTEIKISKIGGGTFDLNYFILTSNTDTGGGPASGNERAWIKNNNGNDQLLPVENWGFPATQIFLGSNYDGITSFSFYVTNMVDCFGMDEFYIDQAAPPGGPSVPDSATTAGLLGFAMVGMVAARRKLSRR